MQLLSLVLAAAVILSVAYLVYGRLLSKLLQLDPNAETPAVKFRDDNDYSPIEPKFLLSQHFSAIAAAGPIVGPIVAGMTFGWLPALLWILIGGILIGGVHDMTALVASIRHKARSIAEVVRDNMSRRAYLLFLSFIWIALVYIVVAFTDLTASTFVGDVDLTTGQVVRGSSIAGSSLIYLVLPIVMGLLLRYTKLSIGWATVIFLPLIGLSIYAGKYLPIDFEAWFDLSPAGAQKTWDALLLLYCLGAAVVPVWLLLQPRGHLGGYFLYVALGAGTIGLLIAAVTGQTAVKYEMFRGWEVKGQSVFPILFITIACGACSGFHSLIASGTTSKQLRRETDARPIGYGAMLLESMVAVISLTCVMIATSDTPVIREGKPNTIYAVGMGQFLSVFGIPAEFAVTFALMAFTTFVYDTLDVCTRLGRYILQELIGWRSSAGAWFATGLTAGVPFYFLMTQRAVGSDGRLVPTWRVFWNLFGASNQLLAALTLLGVTVWLWKTRRAAWVWLVTGVPTVLMYTMSVWALVLMIQGDLAKQGLSLAPGIWREVVATQGWDGLWDKVHATGPVPWIGLVLVALAALMLLEGLLIIAGQFRAPRGPRSTAVPAPA